MGVPAVEMQLCREAPSGLINHTKIKIKYIFRAIVCVECLFFHSIRRDFKKLRSANEDLNPRPSA